MSVTVKREFMEEALDSTGSGKENTEQMKEMIGEFFGHLAIGHWDLKESGDVERVLGWRSPDHPATGPSRRIVGAEDPLAHLWAPSEFEHSQPIHSPFIAHSRHVHGTFTARSHAHSHAHSQHIRSTFAARSQHVHSAFIARS